MFFLVISGAAHFLGATWLLSVSPWARARRRQIWAAAITLASTLSVLRLLGHAFPQSTVLHDVVALALIELVVVMIALPVLGAVAILARGAARVVAKPSPEAVTRREAIERGVGLATVGATASVLGWGAVRGRHAFEIEEVVVKIPSWPRALDGYTIAQVSDIHVGAFIGERELDEGFELVRRVRPDLVVATGDLVDNEAHKIDPLLAQLLRVNARDGAFVILGNHDHYAGAAEVAERIRASKVGLLDNEHVRLRKGDGGGFALVGVDDLAGRGRGAGPDLAQAIRGLERALPRILLAHQPQYFVESQGRIDLQLSGHTHGGQINPGFRPAAAFMEFVAGRYERAGSTLWVNRGFGTTGPPSRIRAAPEITKIVLVSG